MLWDSNFEDLVDSPLARPRRSAGNPMHDVWDGSVWNTFEDPDNPGSLYTRVSGNLVFSLFVDWFNPYHSKRKHVSLGTIALVCLNLPPWDRYREENIFLYGIIPGPKEPSPDQINHLLGPLVEELQVFYKGVWFDQTFRARQGRSIKVVIFPLIADIPALRKTAGHSSHSGRHFCSFCTLPLKEIQCANPKEFPPRIDTGHLSNALKWLGAKSFDERTNIFDQHGVRYNMLNSLSYWRPIEYCSIDFMHCILLGNVKDFCLTYLDVSRAGKLLTNEQDRRRRWMLRISADQVFHTLVCQRATSRPKKRPRGSDTCVEDTGSQCTIQKSKRVRKPLKPLSNTNETSSQRSSKPPSIITKTSYHLRPRRSDATELSTPEEQTRPEMLSTYKSTAGPLFRDSGGSIIIDTVPTSPSGQGMVDSSDSGQSMITDAVPASPGMQYSPGMSSTSAYSSNFSQAPTPSDVEYSSDNSTIKYFPTQRKSAAKGKKASNPINARPKQDGNDHPTKDVRDTRKEGAATGPRLLFEELEALQVAIQKTELPSSVTRVPKQFGSSGSKTLKASEWLVICCVYFPLVLVPLWTFGSNNPHREVLLQTTTRLIGITNLLSSRSISNEEINQFSHLMKEYRELLMSHWSGDELSAKPNIHIAQHFPEVIHRFGPPASTASWAQERLNGILGNISTNNRLSELPLTIFTRWNMKAQYLGLLRGSSNICEKLPPGLTDLLLKKKVNPTYRSKLQGLPEEQYTKWLQKFPNHSTSTDGCTQRFLFFPSTELYKKKYSILDKHPGNSSVFFKHNGRHLVGQIESIFSPLAAEEHKFFVILPFEELPDYLSK